MVLRVPSNPNHSMIRHDQLHISSSHRYAALLFVQPLPRNGVGSAFLSYPPGWMCVHQQGGVPMEIFGSPKAGGVLGAPGSMGHAALPRAGATRGPRAAKQARERVGGRVAKARAITGSLQLCICTSGSSAWYFGVLNSGLCHRLGDLSSYCSLGTFRTVIKSEGGCQPRLEDAKPTFKNTLITKLPSGRCSQAVPGAGPDVRGDGAL